MLIELILIGKALAGINNEVVRSTPPPGFRPKSIFGQPTQSTTTDQPKIPKPPTKEGPALELKKYF